MHLSRPWALLLGLIATVAGGTAHAALITIAFSGTVTDTPLTLQPTLQNGLTISGTYTFDTSIAAAPGSTSSAATYNALTDLQFSIGGYSGSSSGAAELQVDNNVAGADRYALLARGPFSAPLVNGIPLLAFGFRLDDIDQTVFSTALTLPTSIDLTQFENRTFLMFFGPNFGNFDLLVGSVDSLRVVQAPAPAVWSLLLLAGVALLGRNRRSDAHRRWSLHD